MRKSRIFLLLGIILVATFCFVWVQQMVVEKREVGLPGKLSVIEEMFGLISKESVHPVKEEALVEGALRGMTGAINDPYSTYYSEEEAKLHEAALAGERVGVGIELSLQQGRFIIIAPIKGSPAEKAGVKPLDELVQINETKVAGKTMQEAIKLMQGEVGEELVLVVYREAIDQHLKLKMKREELKNVAVSSRVLPVQDEKIGHVMIHLFAENTLEQWVGALSKLQKEGIDGLVIDVRDNPGGYLHSVASVLSTLTDKGETFAYMENGAGEAEPMKTVKLEELESLQEALERWPIVVLQNAGSASASEVMTGALQSWERAMIVGTKSFGKGTVQESWDLSNGGQLKLSTNKWLTPKREWVHGLGVAPDIEVEQHAAFFIERVNLNGTYEEGDFSEAVAYAQRALFALGYNVVKDDGYFDEHFGRIVEQFREDEQMVGGARLDEELFFMLGQRIEEYKQNVENDLQLQMGISYVMHQLGN